MVWVVGLEVQVAVGLTPFDCVHAYKLTLPTLVFTFRPNGSEQLAET